MRSSMNITLPDSVEELKRMYIILTEKFNTLEKEQESKLKEKDTRIDFLLEELRAFKRFIFAHKSEKWTASDKMQAFLFNEAEQTANSETKNDDVKVSGHTRKKPGRKALSDSIPRVVTVHDIPEEEKKDKDGNELLKKIGEDIKEDLVFIPAKIFVEKHVYPKYVFIRPSVQEYINGNFPPEIISAPRKKDIIPRSFATAALLAYIAVSKFMDHIPLYRLERIFRRIGVELSRQTMANWLIVLAKPLRKLIVVMRSDLRKNTIMTADESSLQVIAEPDRSAQQKSWMWLFTTSDISRPILIYKYDQSRAGSVPRKMIGKIFKGHLMTDAFSAYDSCENGRVTLIACWSHVRRKFKNAFDDAKSELSEKFLFVIQRLYLIEKKLRDTKADESEILRIRKNESLPLLETFHQMLIEHQLKISAGGLLGKAISYAMNCWPRLTAYAHTGHLPIDNNFTENYIRPFALGRKNWMFCFSPFGASASAVLYSVTQSAIANGLDPYEYLTYLFEKLPYLKTRKDFEAVAPHRIDPAVLKMSTAGKN